MSGSDSDLADRSCVPCKGGVPPLPRAEAERLRADAQTKITQLQERIKELNQKLSQFQQEENGLKSRGTIAHVMQEQAKEPLAYVLFRGEYDKRRDPVKAATPKVMPAMTAELPKNRLGFAQWLLRPDHPLTSRVTVNRFWQEIFGAGLVKTAEDFGTQGELPTHPELLDWLATEYVRLGWDTKALLRLIVTSASYRQSSRITPDRLERDQRGEGVGVDRVQRLDGMGHGVHAARPGQARREAQRQIRVVDHGARQHDRIAARTLGATLGEAVDRRHLRAGIRGRDGDDRKGSLKSNGLCHPDRTSAAQTENGIHFMRAGECKHFLHLHILYMRIDVVKYGHKSILQYGLNALDATVGLHGTVGAQQQPFPARALQRLPQLRERAGSKNHLLSG